MRIFVLTATYELRVSRKSHLRDHPSVHAVASVSGPCFFLAFICLRFCYDWGPAVVNIMEFLLLWASLLWLKSLLPANVLAVLTFIMLLAFLFLMGSCFLLKFLRCFYLFPFVSFPFRFMFDIFLFLAKQVEKHFFRFAAKKTEKFVLFNYVSLQLCKLCL